MPEAIKTLKDAYRVLQLGGLLVIVVWAWPDTVQLSEVSDLASLYTHAYSANETRHHVFSTDPAASQTKAQRSIT